MDMWAASGAGGAIKLEGERNWNLWKFQISVLLRGMDLYGIVEGSEKKIEGKADEWKKKDAKAQTQIVMRLSEGAMTHILACQTAEEMWSKLHSVYEHKSSTSLHILQQRFFQFKFEDSMDMVTFLAKLQELKTQLKQAGEEVSEKFMVTKVLMSLPARLSHFVSAWESVDPARQTYDELVGRLLIEEERSKSKESESVALYAGGQKQSKATIKRCFKCGKPGHFASQCKSDKDTRKCYKCNKIGHIKSQCQKNIQNASGKNNAFIASALSTMDFMNHPNEHSNKWLVDSGASEHMCFERKLITEYKELSTSNKYVVVGDGRCLLVSGMGNVIVKAFDGQSYRNTTLHGVLFVPELKVNLFSVPSITKKGYNVTLSDEKCLVLKHDELCAVGERDGNFYVMNFILEDIAAIASVKEWHERLCHQNYKHVKEVLTNKNIEFKDGSETSCEACVQGKAHRLPFKDSASRSTQPLELVHADVCGPLEVPSLGEARYFLLIKDDYTKFRHVYFIERKSEVPEKVKIFIQSAERKTGCLLKTFRSDNGKEFVNKELEGLFLRKGIKHETTVPYTPEQNGHAERDMRTLVEAARTMLLSKGLSKELWAEAINTVIYVLNRTSKSHVPGKSPYEQWTGREFDLSGLNKVFGTKVWIHIPKEKRRKLDPKAEEGLFVGYEDTKGYRVYFPDRNEVSVKRDIVFLQDKGENKGEKKNLGENVEKIIYLDQEEIESDSEGQICIERQEEEVNNQEQVEIQESEQAIQQKNETSESNSGLSEETIKRTKSGREVKKSGWLSDYTGFVVSEDEPKSYSEAMKSEDSEHWKSAIAKEIKQLQDNNTWSLIPTYPEGKEVISTKWVLKKKFDENNEIIYKARLVARGFEQTQCDSYDLYAPVAKLNTFRIFMNVATKCNMKVGQMDVCGAFLNSKIDDEIYLELPEGVNLQHKYSKLNKSIYGLKKSPKYWNETINNVLLSLGYKSSDKDCCLFTKCENDIKMYVLLYVDDLLYMGNSLIESELLKNLLCQNFKMKDMGCVKKFLGIEINQDTIKGITTISQREYLIKLLNSYGMSDCRTLSLPIDKNFNFALLKRDSCESKEIETKCRKIIGSLMYVVMGTRPDLCAVVNILSRYQSCASNLLYKLLINILRYIKGTIDICLTYYRDSVDNVVGYVDSDWGGSDDRRSTTGYCFKMYGGTIIWVSKKQPSVSLSSTEAEYIALASATSEACWLKSILKDFCIHTETITMYEDNQSTIKMAHMAVGNSRVKHLDIKLSFVKENISNNVIKLCYINSSDQLADILTKSLGGVLFSKLRKELFNNN